MSARSSTEMPDTNSRRLPQTDVAVIGSGIAGLTVALRCARAGQKVTLVTKKQLEDSSTNWAQGGIAGVLDIDDDAALEQHVQDTLAAGGRMAEEKIVRWVVEQAATRIRDLVSEGVKFDKTATGSYDLAKEGGHTDRRILHSRDRTGAVIEGTLIERLIAENVTILEDTMAVDLILRNKNDPVKGVCGIWCLDSDGTVKTLPAKSVIIATGGAGQLWRETTNPTVSCGDGIAIAYRAGAAVRDLEFVQFHPTALKVAGERPFLITEAIRGAGAVLMSIDEYHSWKAMSADSECATVDEADSRDYDGASNPNLISYMNKIDSRGSLATRDVVARATDIELKRSGAPHVLLITEHLDSSQLEEQFPTISARLKKHGIRLGCNPIPVTPTAHYMVGGLSVNQNSVVLSRPDEDELHGLYAVGEVACTGFHGTNRLASNSLLEAVVFAGRAVEHLLSGDSELGPPEEYDDAQLPLWRAEGLENLIEHAPLKSDREALQATMSDDVGLVRSDARLRRAKRRIAFLSQEIEMLWRASKPTLELVELRNMGIVAGLVTEASLTRRENIGLHHNIDLV